MTLTTQQTRIREEHVAHWHEHGYALVEDFLTPEELAGARENLFELVPTWEQFRAGEGPSREGWMAETWGGFEFPFGGNGFLNQISTHPDIHRFCADVLGTEDVFLSASVISAKYAGGTDFDQPLHSDYGNNTLTFPREDGRFRQVLMILYYSDVAPNLGPTYVVSQQHTRHRPELMIAGNLDETHADVYAREQPAVVKAGTALLYAMHTFHRGSAFRATEGSRFSHHVSYRARDVDWVGHHVAWPRSGGEPAMAQFLSSATPTQREMIGFPKPTDDYWTEETVEMVGRRFPELDMTPYREAIGS